MSYCCCWLETLALLQQSATIKRRALINASDVCQSAFIPPSKVARSDCSRSGCRRQEGGGPKRGYGERWEAVGNFPQLPLKAVEPKHTSCHKLQAAATVAACVHGQARRVINGGGNEAKQSATKRILCTLLHAPNHFTLGMFQVQV